MLFILIGFLHIFSEPIKAQDREIRLELGFSGEMVAGTWNPIKVTLRDQPSATLNIDFDIGSLQNVDNTSSIASYSTELRGGSGVSVFEDDIYIPRWRTLVWSIQTPETTLASGSLERRLSDSRPLHLMVTENPSSIRGQYPEDSRTVSLLGTELSNRPTSYEGVASLVIDDRFVSQRNIIAAASSGTTVIVLDTEESNFDEDFRNFLDATLAGKTEQRLASGWLAQSNIATLSDSLALPKLNKVALGEGLADSALANRSFTIKPPIIYGSIIIYLICILLLVFFGRVPGFITALTLSVLMAVLSQFILTPKEELIQRSRSIVVNAGGLAERLELTQLLSLSAQSLDLPLKAHPPSKSTNIWQATPNSTILSLKRWQNSQLILKPVIVTPTLSWDGTTLENLSDQSLGDVYIFAGSNSPYAGNQTALAAKQSLKEFSNKPDSELPKLYKDLEDLVEQLPEGSVLARSGGQLYLALLPTSPLKTNPEELP